MANVMKLAPIISKWEGGYVNDPVDRGGCTNMGVTIATYKQLINQNGTCEDLKNLTVPEFSKVLKVYWDRWKADQINNQSIANILVDWVWASGKWGIKHPQRVLGVTDDGIVGPNTLNAINGYPDQYELFIKLYNRRKQHFESIATRDPSQNRFLKGWLNRLADFTYKQ